jgi:antitoxin component YwqK of YwqJK toxin-antitoxin module
VKKHLIIGLISSAALFFTGCGNDAGPNSAKEQSGTAREMPNLRDGDFWDGFQSDFKAKFHTDDEERLIRTENDTPFTGELTKRIDAGALAARENYLSGQLHGDSFAWHESGTLKSKTHYQEGLKNGLEIIWDAEGLELSRKHYIDGLEDITKSQEDEDEDEVWGQSAASKALAKWTGNGNEFGEKFAGDPSRDGTLFIRETEELYTGTITALDDSGKKEAELNFKEGKWDGAITKWDLEGNIWEKGEFTAGKLIGFEIKEGKPFDPNQIIESSPFGN